MATAELGQAVTGGAKPALNAALAKVRSLLTVVMKTNTGRIGGAIVALHVFLALFGPWVVPYDPIYFDPEALETRFSAPSVEHLFGTDKFGRDVFSHVLAGARSIVWIAVGGTTLGIFLGLLVGMTSAYLGGRWDLWIMRGVDVWLAFPGLLLLLLVLDLSRKTLQVDESLVIILTLGIGMMPVNSRVIRSAALAVKPLEFVQNARLRGETFLYIIFREILPNILPVVVVEGTLRVGFALLAVSGLGFLGLGVQPPTPDWGQMISEARNNMRGAPWSALAPAFALSSLVVGVNLLTDGIRQALNLPVNR